MRDKPHWPTSERHKLQKKKAKKLNHKNLLYVPDLPGPKGSNYFFAYSQGMLGRAIDDANLSILHGSLNEEIIILNLPLTTKDPLGEYGVIYLPSTQGNLLFNKLDKDCSYIKFGRSIINSLDEKLTFLEETKEIQNTREWLHDETDIMPKGLLGTGMKSYDLGYFLHMVCSPLVGIVFRHGESNNYLYQTIEQIGYHKINSIEGISALRYRSNEFRKPVKNFNPHKITFFSRNPKLNYSETMKQLL